MGGRAIIARPFGLNPRPACRCSSFKCADVCHLFHRQADVIEAVHQAMLFERVKLEMIGFPTCASNRLRFQINFDPCVRTVFCVLHQRVALVFGQNDWQNAVLEAVVVKDIRKAGRDYAADAKISNCPWRVFA